MIELNKVWGIFLGRSDKVLSEYLLLQKFRLYLLEQEKSMDILAYLLYYFLEIKDKPGD
jgi:hypothetical protein